MRPAQNSFRETGLPSNVSSGRQPITLSARAISRAMASREGMGRRNAFRKGAREPL